MSDSPKGKSLSIADIESLTKEHFEKMVADMSTYFSAKRKNVYTTGSPGKWYINSIDPLNIGIVEEKIKKKINITHIVGADITIIYGGNYYSEPEESTLTDLSQFTTDKLDKFLGRQGKIIETKEVADELWCLTDIMDNWITEKGLKVKVEFKPKKKIHYGNQGSKQDQVFKLQNSRIQNKKQNKKVKEAFKKGPR